jgi:hypothetical protein
MSEQLWYTWSDSGFGPTTGYRVRAASANLANVESQRVRTFVNLLRYMLSPDTDLYLPPEKAPLCLTFLKTDSKAGPDSETVLIQKTYTGLDGVRRPGTFFSHLITELPDVPSLCRDGYVPFSAREAIELWQSPLWQKAEHSLPAGRRDLDAIPSNDLHSNELGIPSRYAGSLNVQAIQRIPELFRQVFQAFLTLGISMSTASESKRLYLAGDPDTVATLIWGITHALPRTLDIVRKLTFSTFESDVEAEPKPLIVGTCWLPEYLKKGHEHALLDLPSIYYQANNPHGLAIRGDTPGKATPFSLPHPYIKKYTQFVLDCFSQGTQGMANLTTLLKEAEKNNLSTAPLFLEYYVNTTEPLSKEAVIKLLTDLLKKAENLLKRAEDALQKEKLAEATAEEAQMGNLQPEAELLQRPNVYQWSILALIQREPTWWNSQGKSLVNQLHQQSIRYTKQQLTEMKQGFVSTITSKKEWNKDDGFSAVASVPSLARQADLPPYTILQAFATSLETQVLRAQKDLQTALLPLTQSITDQLINTLWNDQSNALPFWHEAFRACAQASSRILVDTWTYFLQQLTAGNRYTPTYYEWWQQYGSHEQLIQLRHRLSVGSSIAQALTAFATSVASQLVSSIQMNDSRTLAFWSDILELVAPPKSEPAAWASLLKELTTLSYTPAYEDWWRKRQGKARLREILTLLNQSSELNQAFQAFPAHASQLLQTTIQNPSATSLSFAEELLDLVAPVNTYPYLWSNLLLQTKDALLLPSFIQWWKDRGYQATQTLRTFAVNNALSDQLLPFAQAAGQPLSTYLLQEAQQGQQTYDQSILYLLEVLSTSLPAQDNTVWPPLLQHLTEQRAYERLSWKVRSALLQAWKEIAAFQIPQVQNQMRCWCEVSWEELDAFLALGLPADWQNTAIMTVLKASSYPTAVVVFGLVERYPRPFEEALQSMMKASSMPKLAISFFAFLAQNQYAHLLPLLGQLLTVSHNHPQKDRIDASLWKAVITQNVQTTERERATLLEEHCKDLLATYPLSPTMLQLLKEYFADFDVDALNKASTQNLLQNLVAREQQPPLRLSSDLRLVAESWYFLHQFSQQPTTDPDVFKKLNYVIQQIGDSKPDTWQKLLNKLTPNLVFIVHNEETLTWVISTLGKENPFYLLQNMARGVGASYGQERPPKRITLYVRLILDYSQRLKSPEKEQYIDTCLPPLLQAIDTETSQTYWPQKDWPPAWEEEWRNVLNRQQSKELQKALTNFRKAVEEAHISHIIELFDARLQLNQFERHIYTLASNFAAVCQTDNDAGIIQTFQDLKRYFAPTRPRFSPEQTRRIQSAQQRIQQSQGIRQASGPLVQSDTQNTPSSGKGNGILASISNRLPRRNQAQSSGPLPPLETPSAPANEQPYVAKVNGIPISLATLELTIEIKTIYLREWIRQLQATNQEMETVGNLNKQQKETFDRNKNLIDNHNKLLKNVKNLRQATLDDLINDFLIRAEVNRLRQMQDSRYWTQFDLEIETRSNKNRKLLASKYSHPCLQTTDNTIITQVQSVLSIFARREEFNKYLMPYQNLTVTEWLKDLRQKEKDFIVINYEQAKLPQPGKIGIPNLFNK